MISFTEKLVSKTTTGDDFAARIIRDTAIIYTFWLNQPAGKKAFFILEVDKAKHAAFQQALKSSAPADIADYGTVLYAGWDEPSKEKQAEFQKKYGLFS